MRMIYHHSGLVMCNHSLVSQWCAGYSLWNHFCHNNLWRPGLDYVWTTARVMGGISNIGARTIHQTVTSHQKYDLLNIKCDGTGTTWESKWMVHKKIGLTIKPWQLRDLQWCVRHIHTWCTASWHSVCASGLSCYYKLTIVCLVKSTFTCH